MEIAGRAPQKWDALFVFHFLSMEGDQAVGERLQRLVDRKAGNGLETDMLIEAGKKASPSRVLGRFLEADDCTALISAWNAPEGENAWMCYTPNHGMATVTDGKLDWWALICFQCANAGISGPLSQSPRLAPNRLLPKGSDLETGLTSLLPERPFPIRN